MKRALVLAVLALAALAATQSRDRIGQALYAAGFPALAGLAFEDPVWRGAALYARERYSEAAAMFADAPYSAASYDHGTALARAERLAEAVEALNDALYRDPNDEDARYNLALVEALKEKREAEQRDAMNPANASATRQKRGGEDPSSAENEINSTGEGAAGDRDSGREASSPGRAQVSRAGRAQQTRIDEGGGKARGSIGASEGGGRTGGDGAKVAKSFDEALKLPKKSYSQQTVQPSPQWLETIADDPGRFIRMKLAAERAGRAERGIAAPEGTDQW